MFAGLRARALALVVSAAAAGLVCGPPPPGYCPGTNCSCAGGDACDLECPADGCVTQCGDVTRCDATCGDHCDLRCDSSSTCDLACGDGCAAVCESVSSCDVTCGEGCDVACTNLSSCGVTMISGKVTCTSVSECAIQCALPDGGTTPADECEAGVFQCPVGSC
ncbi:MAG: hypothetical protein R3B09_34660 [Nannocystaceae bacterium]